MLQVGIRVVNLLCISDPPINCDVPTLEETQVAIKQLKGGKAAGICGIYGEMIKCSGPTAVLFLWQLICSIWTSGIIPSDWKKGIVIPLWKGKGSRHECNNYRAITLLSVPGKVFARVLLNRVRSHLLSSQRLEQSGFTPKRSTTDRILALRVLIERKREFRQGLLAAYVDLRKAFDSVNRDVLWRILELRGVPTHLIMLMSALYTGTVSAVRWGANISEFFPVNAGVRQGCVLAPTLFNACMDWILGRMAAISGCGAFIGEEKFTDLDFADDAVILAESLDILRSALLFLSEEAGCLGLQVSWVKTKIQSFVGFLDDEISTVSIAGENVEVVERFAYLGSEVHSSGSCVPDISKRLGRAGAVVDSLDQGVWRCRYLSKATKIRVFRSLVMPVLLYGCETWTMTKGLKNRLNVFATRTLRRILGYRWSDFITNDRLLQETALRPVTCQIRERQLRLFGHVARFPVSDPAYRILFTEDPVGWRRPVGRPPTSWSQQVARYLSEMGSDWETALRFAREDPGGYRRMVDAAKRCIGVCSHT